MSTKPVETMDVEQQTPTATITAEINQTAAGAWRGSVKVSVTAPISLVARLEYDKAYAEAFAEIENVVEEQERQGGFPEISVKSFMFPDDPLSPAVLIATPTLDEYQLREAAFRMITDTGTLVRETVRMYNEDEPTNVKVKK